MFVPLNFALVEKGVYRSSYPALKSIPFVQSLQLKTMVCLNPSDIKPELRSFALKNNITIYEFDIKQNQEPFLSMSEAAINESLHVIRSKNFETIFAHY